MKLLSLLVGLCFATTAFADRPNILFAIADDWSPHAGAYGTRWVKTPAFDRVAKEGLLFQHAYTPNAKCAPSRACLLTGRNPWQLEAAANHISFFPPKFKGWGEALTEHGWFVGHTMKGWGPGVARTVEGKKREMTGRAFNKRKATPPTSGISSNDYAENFTDFLDATPPGKPWCFWYGSVEPHRGYEFGSGVAKGGKKLSDIDRVPAFWPDNEIIRNDLLDYGYEVEHFDRHLGRMLNELEKRGLLDNTLVIVTSDHGMPFPRGKGNAGELPNHVPLAVMWKGGIQKPGRSIQDHVSFVDVAPTLVEVAGLKWEDTCMAASPGRSLMEIFRSEKDGQVVAERDHVLIGRERNDIGRPHDWGYPIRGIVTSHSVLLENLEPSRWPAGNPETGYLDCDAGATKTFILESRRKDPADRYWAINFGMRSPEELYDLQNDPDCLRNLALNSESAARKSQLQDQLHAALKAQGDPRTIGQGHTFDEYPHASREHAGFYERYMAGERPQTGWVSPQDFEKKSIPPNSPTEPRE